MSRRLIARAIRELLEESGGDLLRGARGVAVNAGAGAAGGAVVGGTASESAGGDFGEGAMRGALAGSVLGGGSLSMARGVLRARNTWGAQPGLAAIGDHLTDAYAIAVPAGFSTLLTALYASDPAQEHNRRRKRRPKGNDNAFRPFE